MIDPDEDGPMDADDYVLVAKVIIGCALAVFIAITAPASYHLAQPAEHYLDVDDVTVDLTTEDEYEDPCTFELSTTYYARYDQVITVETTLYAVENESLAEVQGWREEAYLPAGVHEISFERSIHEPLSYGTYQFHFTVAFEAPRGFEKTLEVESELFLVHHGPSADDDQRPTGSNLTVTESGEGSATITTPEPTRTPTPTPVAPGIDTVFAEYPAGSRCP